MNFNLLEMRENESGMEDAELDTLIALDSPLGTFLAVSPVITAVLLLLSPSTDVYKIHKMKSTMSLSNIPYLSLLLSVTNWSLYGIFIWDMSVLLCNLFGFCCAWVYVIVYHRYAKREQMKKIYVYYGIMIAFYIGLGTTLVVLRDQKVEIMSVVTLVTYFVFLLSPFVTLRQVLTTKRVDSLPFDLSFVLFINSILWTLYGTLVIDDLVLYIPNGGGIFLSSLQLLCHVIYGDVSGSLRKLFCGCCMSKKAEEMMVDGDEDSEEDKDSEDFKKKRVSIVKAQSSAPVTSDMEPKVEIEVQVV